MIFSDPQALIAAVFARLAEDDAGAPVRDLLGAGAGSIIHARRLRDQVLPLRPILALRAGSQVPLERVLNQASFTWWVYDDPAQDYARINALLRPISDAYDRRRYPLATPTVAAGSVQIQAGQETEDTALGLLVRPVYLTIIC